MLSKCRRERIHVRKLNNNKGIMRHSNICLVEVSVVEERNGIEAQFEEIMTELFRIHQ